MHSKNFLSRKKGIGKIFGIFLVILMLLSFYFNNGSIENKESRILDNPQEITQSPRESAAWARLNLTNPSIDGKIFTHNTQFQIEGRLFDPLPPQNGFNGYTIAAVVNGSIYSLFNDITSGNGEFNITFTVPTSWDVYSEYKIQAIVTSSVPGSVNMLNYFTVYTNATPYFQLNSASTNINPKIPGENYYFSGFFRATDAGGILLPNKQIDYYWHNSTDTWGTNYFNVNQFGSIGANIQIPSDAYSEKLTLNISYAGDPGHLSFSTIELNFTLFRNITCVWNTVKIAEEGERIRIRGQLSSLTNNSLKISNRYLTFYYNLNPIGNAFTDANGYFDFKFTIPNGVGNSSIAVAISGSPIGAMYNFTFLNITAATADPVKKAPTTETPPPFLNFLEYFIPILAAIIGLLAVLGYRYLKKQEKESRVVKIPLEERIKNLKILKESGRLEEALSYLFNAIFMDLINGKFGRKRKVTETIRDFAIISVRELKLNPTNVYPFTQKIEAIIYDRPFAISEKDFYDTCNLFSPIYYELTGYNFIVKF